MPQFSLRKLQNILALFRCRRIGIIYRLFDERRSIPLPEGVGYMKWRLGCFLCIGLFSGCAYFQDMLTGKGSYMWCCHQTQPVPACNNYGLDSKYEDDSGDSGED